MKHTLRLLKSLLICSILALTSCQDDSADRTAASEINVIHRHLNFEQFSKLYPQTASRLVQQNEKSLSRSLQRGEVYDEQNDFTILTDKIFMGENEGGSYYTFQITRDNGDFQGLENLVLISDGEGGFIPLLTKYSLTDEELMALSNGGRVQDLGQKMTYEALEGVDFGSSSSKGIPCMIHIVAYCSENHPDHNGGVYNGAPCPAHAEALVMSGDCGNGGIFGPGYSDPGPGNGPGTGTGEGAGPGTGSPGGGPTPPAPPIITSPVMEEIYIDPKCRQLQAIKGQFLLPLMDLKNTLGQNAETGYSLKKNGSGTNFTTKLLVDVYKPREIKIPMRINQFGILHNHNKGAYEMFSMYDVNTLRAIANYYQAPNGTAPPISMFMHVMVVKNKTYAIMIDDTVKLASIGRHFNSDLEAEAYNDDLGDKYISRGTPDNANQEGLAKDFLKFVKDLGISLYRTDNTFGGKWEKLELDPINNEGPLKSSDCN